MLALLFPVWCPFFLLWEAVKIVGRMTIDSDATINPGSKQVPTFYSGKPSETTDGYSIIAALLIAVAFGGIHCIAWSFQFPSHPEQLIWRISSLTITCAPAFELVTLLIAGFSTGWVQDWFGVIGLVVLPPYIFARGIPLLVLPLMALRSLPPRHIRYSSGQLSYHIYRACFFFVLCILAFHLFSGIGQRTRS